jgi:hypothetical protein
MGFEAMLLEFRVARQLEIDFVAPLSSYGLPDPNRGEVYQEPPPLTGRRL